MIATKTKIDISEVQLPEALGDGYFKRKAQPKKSSGGESEIFQDSEQVGQAHTYLSCDARLLIVEVQCF